MEELQDAIEDAQYVNAISSQDDGPRPVLPWNTATEEELATWKQQMLSRDKNAFGLDWTLSSAIGMFLFSAFLKDDCHDYVRINFSEQVMRWKKLRGRHRIDKAKDIIDAYLTIPRIDQEGNVKLPRKTQIDEYDLARSVPSISANEIAALYETNYDESNTESIVGLKGSILQEINVIMENLEKKPTSESNTSKADSAQDEQSDKMEAATPDEKEANDPEKEETTTTDKHATSTPNKEDENTNSVRTDPRFEALRKQLSAMNIDRRQSRARKYLPDDLFDKAEAIVMESLRKQYWDAFTESEKYKKMDNFHWYKDKRVVPEDFFILRVLGRGGFGLVTGEC